MKSLKLKKMVSCFNQQTKNGPVTWMPPEWDDWLTISEPSGIHIVLLVHSPLKCNLLHKSELGSLIR